jgi:hypothetical protein
MATTSILIFDDMSQLQKFIQVASDEINSLVASLHKAFGKFLYVNCPKVIKTGDFIF